MSRTHLDPDLPYWLRQLYAAIHDPDLLRAAALIEDMTRVLRAAEDWRDAYAAAPEPGVSEPRKAYQDRQLSNAVDAFQAANPEQEY